MKQFIKENEYSFITMCLFLLLVPCIVIKFPYFICFTAFFDPIHPDSKIIHIGLGNLSILLLYILLFYIINKRNINKELKHKKFKNKLLCIIFIIMTTYYLCGIQISKDIATGTGFFEHHYKDLEIINYPRDKQEHIDWIINRLEIEIE